MHVQNIVPHMHSHVRRCARGHMQELQHLRTRTHAHIHRDLSQDAPYSLSICVNTLTLKSEMGVCFCRSLSSHPLLHFKKLTTTFRNDKHLFQPCSLKITFFFTSFALALLGRNVMSSWLMSTFSIHVKRICKMFVATLIL